MITNSPHPNYHDSHKTLLSNAAESNYSSATTLTKKPAMLTPNSIEETLTERGKRYGTFTGHAEVTQLLKRIMRDALMNRLKDLPDDQQEALDMIAHKIGRIINGDHNYADSWVDIAGYAKLIADRLDGNEK